MLFQLPIESRPFRTSLSGKTVQAGRYFLLPGARDGMALARPADSAYGTGQGRAFQISAAYSAIVRSLENRPEPATFRIAFLAQPSRSA